MKNAYLKPQDIVVLFRILTWTGEDWSYERLSEALGMSASHVYYAIQRAQFSRLYDAERGRIRRHELREFLTCGIRYAFAVHPGTSERGIPTAHSADWAEEYFAAAGGENYVWPHPGGAHRGLAVRPLYKTVPEVVMDAPELHDLLAIVDTLRLGSSRERGVAAQALDSHLGIEK